MTNRSIPFGQLADYVDGLLPPDEAARLRVALDGADPAAVKAAEWLQAFADLRQAIPGESASHSVETMLRERFAAYTSLRRTRPELRIHLATTRFDTAAAFAGAGVRSPLAVDAHRHLLYTTDIADVAVDVHRRAGGSRLDVLGQLFPSAGHAPDAFRVQLSRGADSLGVQPTDDLGEFLFPNVAPGDYHMILSAGDVGILVTPVNLD
jgi:hypothetical protein